MVGATTLYRVYDDQAESMRNPWTECASQWGCLTMTVIGMSNLATGKEIL